VFETLVSSGLPQWPTVTGEYRTYMKYESQTMNGYLWAMTTFCRIPYVMYFYEDYAIHGTYWHSSFGTPMSHGCVNVSTPDAGWLFNWAPSAR
jgi:lipoprotein-anchoring transpeptidase ErfK/SrfK